VQVNPISQDSPIVGEALSKSMGPYLGENKTENGSMGLPMVEPA